MVRYRSEAKEQALVDAAIRLFLDRGIRRTKIQDIAEAADVAVGTFYTYHKDKIAVLRRVAFAFAERHHDMALAIIESKRSPLAKLNTYILSFYDMWRPFGNNSRGAVELAEAVIKHAPETLKIAQKEYSGTIEQILREGRRRGLTVQKPTEEARWIAICTMAFFPLAGTPTIRPLSAELNRNDLEGLLKWIGRKLSQ